MSDTDIEEEVSEDLDSELDENHLQEACIFHKAPRGAMAVALCGALFRAKSGAVYGYDDAVSKSICPLCIAFAKSGAECKVCGEYMRLP